MKTTLLSSTLLVGMLAAATGCGGGGGGSPSPSPPPSPSPTDTTPPDTSLTTTPAALATSASASFTASATEAGSTFQASVDSGAYATVAASFTINNLADGAHSISVRARDTAGNVDATPATFTWQIDASAPAVRIVFPTAVSYTDADQLNVRGTASDAQAISGVTINGVTATTSDGYAHWAALVPLAAGNNTLTVSATDSLGNSAAGATATVANRGPVQYAVYRLAWDGARNRALVSGSIAGTIFAARDPDGHMSVFSGPSRGTGPALASTWVLVMDAANNRVLSIGTAEVIEVDLDSGNRTLIPTAAPTVDTTPAGGMVCNSPCTQLYGYTMYQPSGQSSVFSIDLATGARTVVSGPFGGGPSITDAQGIVLDSSTGTPRLLISDTSHRAIIAVNLGNADRTYLSEAQVGSGPTLTRPGGMVLDAANNRLLVIDEATTLNGRLFAIDLSTGNRTVLAGGNSSWGITFGQALDSANSRLLLAQYQPARISQLDLGTGQVARFSDSNVGTGPVITGESVLLDGPSGNRSLLASGRGGVVRVNLATGVRTAAVSAIFPNSTVQFAPQNLAFDTRPGVPAGRIFFSSASSSAGTFLFSGDLANGTSSLISTGAQVPYGSQAEFPLDAANGRLLVNYPTGTGSSRIAPLVVATGALGPAITDAASVGALNAMALDPVPGGATRLLGANPSGEVFAYDLATGTRTDVSTAAVGSGPSAAFPTGLSVDPATRRAWAVGGADGSLHGIDLANGNRTLLSGRDFGTQARTGTGPRIEGYPRLVVDVGAEVAYVTSNADSLLAIDLVSGDRVITAR